MYQNPYAKLRPKTRTPYTEIFFIRHCHPEYSLEPEAGEHNLPLSKTGLKQRRYLTAKLLKMRFDKIYSSGLLRAQQTAAAYADKAKQTVVIDQRLDEIDWQHWYRIKYFHMSEKTRGKRLAHYRALDRELDKAQASARRALDDIWRHNRHKRRSVKIAIFSHGNFIKALFTGILNADVIGFLSLEIFQSSISKLVIDRDGYVKISYINDASHLPSPPKEDLFVTLID